MSGIIELEESLHEQFGYLGIDTEENSTGIGFKRGDSDPNVGGQIVVIHPLTLYYDPQNQGIKLTYIILDYFTPAMEPEEPIKVSKLKLKTYAKTWKQFLDRAMEILIENPTTSRYVLKYLPDKNTFLIKITDGQKIVMKKVNARKQYE